MNQSQNDLKIVINRINLSAYAYSDDFYGYLDIKTKNYETLEKSAQLFSNYLLKAPNLFSLVISCYRRTEKSGSLIESRINNISKYLLSVDSLLLDPLLNIDSFLDNNLKVYPIEKMSKLEINDLIFLKMMSEIGDHLFFVNDSQKNIIYPSLYGEVGMLSWGNHNSFLKYLSSHIESDIYLGSISQ